MKAGHFLTATQGLVKAKILKKKTPLAVSWALTFRCNQKCRYCGLWQRRCEELDTKRILFMLKQLKKLGTRWISFTGGEPLLRDDIGEIINYAREEGIYASLSSNGRLVPNKINQLKNLNRIKLSLDGPPEINDQLRGKGSALAVEEAVKQCRNNNIHVCLECVLSKYNLKSLDWVLNFAVKNHLQVLFQPATEDLLWSNQPNPVAAAVIEYREAVKYLIAKKIEKAPILNSLAGLSHLSHWPEAKKIPCVSGILSFDIEPDGTILACDRVERISGQTAQNGDIKKAMEKIGAIKNCCYCWCSSLIEFNLITSFNLCAVKNFLKNN